MSQETLISGPSCAHLLTFHRKQAEHTDVTTSLGLHRGLLAPQHSGGTPAGPDTGLHVAHRDPGCVWLSALPSGWTLVLVLRPGNPAVTSRVLVAGFVKVRMDVSTQLLWLHDLPLMTHRPESHHLAARDAEEKV